MSKSFEDRFFEELAERFNRQDARMDKQDSKLEKILTQAQKTNGRVNKHDEQIKTLEASTGRKLNVPPNVLYLLAVAAVIALIIVANLMGYDIKGVI